MGRSVSKRGLERLRQRIYREPKRIAVPTVPVAPTPRGVGIDIGTTHWWALGYTDSGKRCVLGPYGSEEEAILFADKLNEPETFELKTRDQSKAVKQIRAILLRSGVSPDEAITRQLHERGLARELSR